MCRGYPSKVARLETHSAPSRRRGAGARWGSSRSSVRHVLPCFLGPSRSFREVTLPHTGVTLPRRPCGPPPDEIGVVSGLPPRPCVVWCRSRPDHMAAASRNLSQSGCWRSFFVGPRSRWLGHIGATASEYWPRRQCCERTPPPHTGGGSGLDHVTDLTERTPSRSLPFVFPKR
jgi:hypothetical protein